MVIDHKKKFIFIHVFRTGGSSIEHSFGGSDPHYNMHTKLEDIPNWKKYFSFGFVRNPWDRLVSSYMYLTQRKQFNGSWEQYVLSFAKPPLNESKKFAQHDMLKNCNFIGRFEYFQKDYNEICKIIDMPKKKLPHVWKTKHPRYVNMFSPGQLDIIMSASSGDIEHYGFSFKSAATKNFGRVR